MNKILLWLPAFIILVTIAYKPIHRETKPNLVNDIISFSIYKGSSYNSPVYGETSAQLEIIIEKVNAKGQHAIVWNKKYDSLSISLYPSRENAFRQKVTVNNISRKEEFLIVHYILHYNSKGSKLNMHEAAVVKDDNSADVAISI
jgi:hypothetical protein